MAIARGLKLAAAVLAAITAGCTTSADSGSQVVPGLQARVEILRDQWGVPHVYAQNQDDLFFANGWINARDRLFQLDLWRRAGTGRFSEVLGARHLERDRVARLLSYRGDWHAEWASYSPDTWQIARAFTNGINAYIRSLNGVWPEEFRVAGYAPGEWMPNDVVARIAGLSISRSLLSEVTRSQEMVRFGPAELLKLRRFDPPVELKPPAGVNLADVSSAVTAGVVEVLGRSPFSASGGSNNWVVDGTKSITGKPLLAADPHRGLEVPSLRRTIHLVAPGWNVIGSGEPALPGVALGHNDQIAYGFTITGTDQQDLYVEELNPANAYEYRHKGEWRRMRIERVRIGVKGEGSREVELQYTVHGPVLHIDRSKRVAYAVRWVGLEPGGAGYLAGLALARARNWTEFRSAMARFKVPSENMVYADLEGNIGMQVAGLTPVRPNHTGLLPVSGTGDYEWAGYVPAAELPSEFNPARHYIATANNNILPPAYRHKLNYEWAPPYRAQRASELLAARRRFSVADFERMQHDTVSLPARRFAAAMRRWRARSQRLDAVRSRIAAWDGTMAGERSEPLIYLLWISRLGAELFGRDAAAELEFVLQRVESGRAAGALETALGRTVAELERALGADTGQWQWSRANRVLFVHPLEREEWNLGPVTRGGDTTTLNAAGGAPRRAEGASYRQVIDHDHTRFVDQSVCVWHEHNVDCDSNVGYGHSDRCGGVL